MVPKALREGLQSVHHKAHEAAERVPSGRRVIVDENHLAARDDAGQQRNVMMITNFAYNPMASSSNVNATSEDQFPGMQGAQQGQPMMMPMMGGMPQMMMFPPSR